MHRFEDIYGKLEEISEARRESLHKVTQIIYTYYLTPKEKIYFRCLELYYQNKKQRELSVLLNVDQPNLSAKFAKLRRKLKVVADYLTQEDLDSVFNLHNSLAPNPPLTPRQYEVLMYLLAGNKAYHISKHLKVSPVAIHQTVNYLKRKLPKDCLPMKFLNRLGSI